MSLAKAIQFGSLVTQLTPAGKASFVRDLAASDGQMIIDALSSYFLYGLRSENQIMRTEAGTILLRRIIECCVGDCDQFGEGEAEQTNGLIGGRIEEM